MLHDRSGCPAFGNASPMMWPLSVRTLVDNALVQVSKSVTSWRYHPPFSWPGLECVKRRRKS